MRPSRRRAALPVAILVLLVGVACGSGGDSPRSAAPTAGDAAVPQTAETPGGAVLDDPGAEPRQPLVLRVPAGTTVRAAIVNKIGLKLTLDGTPVPEQPAPVTRVVIEERVDRVDPDGTMHYDVSFPEVSVVPTAGVDPSVARQAQAGLEQLKGIRATGSVGPQGDAKELNLDTGAVSDPVLRSLTSSMSSQVGNLSTPFPEDPVGVGARWTVRRTATINGLVMDTTTRYTLRSRTGDHYELDVTQDAVSPPGPATLENLPVGGQISVETFAVNSRGQVTGDLTRPLPVRSTLNGTGDGTFTAAAGRERATIRQQMTLELTTSPA